MKVGVIGGGISGSTVALFLAERGIEVELFEKGTSLVNGPPACHLHAGGNLYREISDQQCLKLLKQSIDTYRLYPHAINHRPTVIAVPKSDRGETVNLLPRLNKLRDYYRVLVKEDAANEVLGKVDDYFKLYSKKELEELSQKDCPETPRTLDDWMIPMAKSINLFDYKTDFILVQEYGLSMFRAAAVLEIALDSIDNCSVFTNTNIQSVKQLSNGKWQLNTEKSGIHEVDYLVNACGYKTGLVDDSAGFKRQRMVEFKSAYVTRWTNVHGVWPEVIFHGVRGTADGMGSLTPYAGGYFQLHGMTEDITLFENGLVASCQNSSQPALSDHFEEKLSGQWSSDEVKARTQNAIDHIARLVPDFSSAEIGGPPMFGAQQIPGNDPSLRVADVSFEGTNYARTEIVKWSSALTVAEKIYDHLPSVSVNAELVERTSKTVLNIPHEKVVKLAQKIAADRGYPSEMASDYDAVSH